VVTGNLPVKINNEMKTINGILTTILMIEIIVNLKGGKKFTNKNRDNMQFLLTAYDGTDPDAPARRLKVREEHIENINRLKRTGECLFGGAILNEDGNMIGSMIVYEFPDRQSLDSMLTEEIYINNGVWEKIEIKPFRMAKTG
jgi:hypothetical protein